MHALVSIYFQKFDTNVEVQDHVLPVIFICEPIWHACEVCHHGNLLRVDADRFN
jgi:hypothetical protein